MGAVIVINHVTLDGVMQGPGRAEEDPRDGFAHGGWAGPGAGDQVTEATYARVARSGGLRLLLGRRTYEGMLGYWNTRESPFTQGLNDAPKHVASRTLREPLPRPNSTLLRGDVGEAVARLKRDEEGDLHVMGSGDLVQTLRRHGLVDEYLLFVHPLVLGSGRRLFGDGGPAAPLRLLRSEPTSTGVVIVQYEVVG